MSSLSCRNSDVVSVNQGASVYRDYYRSQALMRPQSELAHHENQYTAGEISCEERKACIRAWLEGMSRIVGDTDTSAETPVASNNISNNSKSPAIFIGAHLDMETSTTSNAPDLRLEGTTAFGEDHDDGQELKTPVDIDDADKGSKPLFAIRVRKLVLWLQSIQKLTS